ncbi:MAG: copper-binding protein [Verrucomicrobiota bacterium]
MSPRSLALRFFALALALLLAGCGPSQPAPHTYAARGVIEHISADQHIVTIHHEAIPGYMMAMTMDFPVRDGHLLDGFAPGDQVAFTLRVADDDAWVDSVQRLGHVDLPATNAASALPPALKPGDPLPDAEFLAENGRTVHLSDFRGRVVIFTFFFTRCPLPNYCPLMNRNFSRTRDLLLADPAAPKNWQFLSISFDPDFDRPQTLVSYAGFYRHDNPDRWLFVSATPQTLGKFASPLGLIVSRQDSTISHNLRTVVVDPQGRLFRQFNDNLWTAEQLAQAVKDTAGAAPSPAK